jgi:signal transduction histidine kinase/CheY-like chemotaxis protein
MAMLVALFSRFMFEVPGTGGLKSNFTEVALVLALPFVPHWSLAAVLALFAGFSDPDKFILYSLNHALTYPLLWLAYRRWGLIAGTMRFAGVWILLVAVYYFALLLPATLGLMAMAGELPLLSVPAYWVKVASHVGHEYLVTTFVALFYLLMIRELRDHRAAQKDLEARNAELSRHKQILEAQYDATQEGILVVSDDLRLVSWNQRFVEMWQVPQEVLRSGSEMNLLEHARELVVDADQFAQTIGRLYSDPQATCQDLVRLKDGRTLVRFTTAIRYGDKLVPERMWFFRDITDLENAQAEREILQAKLFQSQKMEAIGQLAGGVAHDFNNSLGVILGAAELAGMADIPEESRSYLDMIVTAARRASSLTRKLLSFSRQGTRSMDLIDAGAVARDTVSLLQSSIDKRITLAIENKATRSYVMGDTGLLQNALMNLGINASHAMPEGGAITVTLDNLHLDEDYCEASPFKLVPGDYLEIGVRDTGSGIAPENLSRIFEPFFTTKEEGKGTGLGLASVFGVMQDHDGAITVYSELGAGTAFRLYFPLPPDTLGLYEDTTTQSESIPTGTGTILLADDEEMIRQTAGTMLERLGYTVLFARDGLEALEVFQAHQGEIGLVLLDMIMPKLGGRQTFERLRELDSALPIVICSGFSKADDLEALKDKGISGFLQKPFRRAQLAQAVASSIRDAK